MKGRENLTFIWPSNVKRPSCSQLLGQLGTEVSVLTFCLTGSSLHDAPVSLYYFPICHLTFFFWEAIGKLIFSIGDLLRKVAWGLCHFSSINLTLSVGPSHAHLQYPYKVASLYSFCLNFYCCFSPYIHVVLSTLKSLFQCIGCAHGSSLTLSQLSFLAHLSSYLFSDF